MNTFVVQCGVLYEKNKIERGFKQGDPISSYLFLTVAEILALLMKMNPEIIGIKISTKEFKLICRRHHTFFRWHTTLFAGGIKYTRKVLVIFQDYESTRKRPR